MDADPRTTAEGELVGFERVTRALVHWDGERGADHDDRLVVDPEEVGSEELTKTHEGRVRIEWLPGALTTRRGRA